jgi:hypothetical protein
VTTALAYGPQTDRIETLLGAVRKMTTAEITAVRDAEKAAEKDAVWYAVSAAARAAERGGAWVAAWVAARRAGRGLARGPAWDAAAALAVLDLVGRYGLTRKHVDALAAPILTVMPRLGHLFEPIDHTETEPRS